MKPQSIYSVLAPFALAALVLGWPWLAAWVAR